MNRRYKYGSWGSHFSSFDIFLTYTFTPTHPGRNPFGFNTKKHPSPQFQALLGLTDKEDIFQNIEDSLMNIANKHLDVKLPPLDQKRALARIENELKDKFPRTYNGEESEKRLYYAVRVVMYKWHGIRRIKLKRPARKSKRGPPSSASKEKQVEIYDLTMDSDPGSEIDTDDDMISVLELDPSSITTKIENYDEFEKEQIGTDAEFRNRSIALNESSKTIEVEAQSSSSFVHCSRSRDPPDSNPSIRARSIISQVNEHNNNPPQLPVLSREAQFAEVNKFLSSCDPPMARLLHLFVDFGCTSEDYLRSLAKCSPDQRDRVLKKMLRAGHPAGVPIPEIDVAMLEVHLESYFLDKRTST